jgi:hypothetical protein
MPKLEDLDIGETSGVDHPAHLSEGWLMMKSAGSLLKEMSKCPHCGAAYASGDKFCPSCGEEVPEGAPAEKSVDRLRRLHKALGEVLEHAEGGEMSETQSKTPEAVVEALKDAPEDVRKAVEDAFAKTEVETPEPDEDEVLKSVPESVRKALDEQRERADRLEKALDGEVQRRETEEAVAKAKAWSGLGVSADEFGPVLRKLRGLDSEVADEVEKVLDGATKVAETSEVFRTIGKSTSGGGDASSRLDAMTREFMSKATEPVSFAEAQAKVLDTAEGQRLYDESRRETTREGSH